MYFFVSDFFYLILYMVFIHVTVFICSPSIYFLSADAGFDCVNRGQGDREKMAVRSGRVGGTVRSCSTMSATPRGGL